MKDDLIDQVQKDVIAEQKYSDGITQIVAGLFLMLAMLFSRQGQSTILVVFIPLVPILIEALRKRFTYPRVGYAKPREQTKARLAGMWIVLALLIAGLVAYFTLRGKTLSQEQSRQFYLLTMYGVAGIVIVLALLMSLVGKRRDFIWFALIAVVFVVGGRYFVNDRFLIFAVVAAIGALLFIQGVWRLIRFMKKYPVLSDE